MSCESNARTKKVTVEYCVEYCVPTAKRKKLVLVEVVKELPPTITSVQIIIWKHYSFK
jgi:hypothetical protein